MRASTLFAASLILVGCGPASETTSSFRYEAPVKLSGQWTITDVNLDRGHLTYENSNRDHTYVRGVQCNQESRSIVLLYYDQLPDDLSLSIGDRLAIDRNADTELDPSFSGFWISDLKITKH